MKKLLVVGAFSVLLALGGCISPGHEKTTAAPRMMPLGAHPLFDGASFAGWKISTPNPYWTFSADGVLTGDNENDPAVRGYDLYTEKSYKDIEFEIEFRYTGDADSGVYLRKPLIQVQVGVSSSLHTEKTGSLFQEGRGGGYVANATGVDKLLKVGDWNKFRFIAQGDSLKVWLNGSQVLDTSIAKYPDAAPLGLQLHPGVKMKIEFRNGWVREL
jgi:Domain of Unknown Function (DUF1080)